MGSVTIAMVLSTVLAAAAVFLGLHWMRKSSILARPGMSTTRVMRSVPVVLSIVMFPFAWWLGVILGGNFGGAIAASIVATERGGQVLVSIGIALGIFMVTAVISLAAAFFGLLLMRLITR